MKYGKLPIKSNCHRSKERHEDRYAACGAQYKSIFRALASHCREASSREVGKYEADGNRKPVNVLKAFLGAGPIACTQHVIISSEACEAHKILLS